MIYSKKFNNYNLKPKNSSIYTPPEVSQFIFNLLKEKISKEGTIIDPCSGMGSLLRPWAINDYFVLGIDNDPNSTATYRADFFTAHLKNWANGASLILCNPPFNGMAPKLAPEIWLDKIIEHFGKEIPIVFFAPIGLRICHSLTGERYQKFLKGKYPSISSIITLPRTIFPQIEFHTEILIFNIPNLKPHYFFNHHYEPPIKSKCHDNPN